MSLRTRVHCMSLPKRVTNICVTFFCCEPVTFRRTIINILLSPFPKKWFAFINGFFVCTNWWSHSVYAFLTFIHGFITRYGWSKSIGYIVTLGFASKIWRWIGNLSKNLHLQIMQKDETTWINRSCIRLEQTLRSAVSFGWLQISLLHWKRLRRS